MASEGVNRALKLCQKCITAILEIVQPEVGRTVYPYPDTVSESECEFWAHAALRRMEHALAVESDPLLAEMLTPEENKEL